MSKSKKSLVLVLCLIMLIVSVTGCNVPKKSDVVGVYNNVGILREEGVTCILREDDTYDQISKTGILNQKGTFSRVLNGWVALKDRNGKNFENIGKFGDYFYIIDFNTNGYGASAYFEKDSDYGKLFTIDSDGKIDQTFTDFYFPTFLDEKNTMQWYTVKIQFKKDGTFEMHTHAGIYCNVLIDYKTYSGTYSVDGKIIKLNYDGSEHILLIIGKKIYYDVIQKAS